MQKCITALNRTWHPEHFACAHCGQPFGDDSYHEKDGKPYCRYIFGLFLLCVIAGNCEQKIFLYCT